MKLLKWANILPRNNQTKLCFLLWMRLNVYNLNRFSCVCVCVLVAQSCPTLATPWTVARQAPPSTEFSRQEYWSRLPFPSAGDWTQVSCIAGRFFTSWVTRGAFKERYWKLSHKNKGIWERIGWLRKLWIHSKWIKKDNVNTYVLVGCSNCSYERPKTF